jgi:hypothetical protein
MAGRGRFLHVGFIWGGVPKTQELVPVFDNALDWIRYAPNCWILWTTSEPGAWLTRIRPHLTEKDSVTILELNLAIISENYTGWASKTLWDWIDKYRKA